MIKEALNKSTGKTTPIGEASKDEEYECLFCHVDMYPAQGQDLEWHYRCKRGHHKRTFCAQMAQCSHNNRIIHDVEGIIPENFFDGLYRPEKEDGDGGGQHPVALLLVELTLESMKLFLAVLLVSFGKQKWRKCLMT